MGFFLVLDLGTIIRINLHDYQVVSKSSDKLLVSDGMGRETGFQEPRKQFRLKLQWFVI